MPAATSCREVPVRGGDHPHVDAARGAVADAADLAVLEHAQQLGLQRARQLADLVEEQRAAAASSNSPRWSPTAPVKAPRTWPKSSDSSSASGIAAQLTATNGWPARGERRWSSRATTSLPVPL